MDGRFLCFEEHNCLVWLFLADSLRRFSIIPLQLLLHPGTEIVFLNETQQMYNTEL